jgi:hypothetical protein
MRLGVLAAGAALFSGLASSAASAAVTQDNFPPRNTADLVALCSAQRSAPLFAAAINYCQGFVEGAVETALSYAAVGLSDIGANANLKVRWPIATTVFR